jgi:metallo-beta-lactamase class B
MFFACGSSGRIPADYISDSLQVKRLTSHVYGHISNLRIPNSGNFPCNGLIYENQGEVVIFDTPTTDAGSKELLQWVRSELHCEIRAVVINQFHVDCLGGLGQFHREGIPSYAHKTTIQFAREKGDLVPQIGFDETDTLMLGNKRIINHYFGEGHTKDNIVSYLQMKK